MKHREILILFCITFIVAMSGAACSQSQAQNITYDPSKSYAAFLVVNSEYGKDSLVSMRARSLQEGYEIGPIEPYNPGIKDFEPILRRLTSSKQVKIVWIISSYLDVPDIKKAQAKIDYTGAYRYVPISDQTGPMKITQ